uniref:Uncharacterized protein n=1 Tax=Romanomermis culicivorax TaxID=13658 RepID=A0A915JHD8_ROMCU
MLHNSYGQQQQQQQPRMPFGIQELLGLSVASPTNANNGHNNLFYSNLGAPNAQVSYDPTGAAAAAAARRQFMAANLDTMMMSGFRAPTAMDFAGSSNSPWYVKEIFQGMTLFGISQVGDLGTRNQKSSGVVRMGRP